MEGGSEGGGEGGDVADAAVDGASSGPLPWHLDTDFAGGIGYVELLGHSTSSASPGSLALLEHPTLGVVVVAMDEATSCSCTR